MEKKNNNCQHAVISNAGRCDKFLTLPVFERFVPHQVLYYGIQLQLHNPARFIPTNVMTKALLTILFILLTSFSQGQTVPHTLSDTLIKVEVNNQFELELQTITDGGHRLFLEHIDTTGIQIIFKDPVKKSRDPWIGAGSYEIWTFLALQKGEFVLEFYYKRPRGNDILKRIRLRIIVY